MFNDELCKVLGTTLAEYTKAQICREKQEKLFKQGVDVAVNDLISKLCPPNDMNLYEDLHNLLFLSYQSGFNDGKQSVT